MSFLNYIKRVFKIFQYTSLLPFCSQCLKASHLTNTIAQEWKRPFNSVTMCNNQSGAPPCGPSHRERTFFSLCSHHVSAFMKLSGEIFAVQHSFYSVSKFELSRPSECRENGTFFCDNMNMKKTMKIQGL